MRYLLDTNTCVAVLSAGWGALVPGAQTVSVGDLAVSAITVWELEGGGVLSARPGENRRRLDALTAEVRLLPFDHAAARQAGELHAELERTGARLQTADCLIAGQALASGLTLVTHDRDFIRVPKLNIIDWLPAGFGRGKRKSG